MPLTKSPWFYPLLACFLLLFLFAFRMDVDYDMGFHLRAGEWILQHHAIPRKDSFTYTVRGSEYIDLHWLYQAACYGLYRLAGYPLLSLAHLLLILAAFALTAFRMERTGAPSWALPLLLFPTALAVELRFLDRPETVSWVLLALTLLVLDLRMNHNRNFLFLLPLFQLLWVNVEGLFFLGWAAMGAYGLSNRVHRRRFDRQLFKYGLAAFAADLLNPYFLKGLAFPFLLFTRLEGSNLFKRSISEFQSPWSLAQSAASPFLPALPVYGYRILSLVLLALVALTFRKRKVHELILVPVFFALSAAAIRNVPLFFLAALPAGAASLGDLARSRDALRAACARLDASRARPRSWSF
jgi:hypothetical protein